MALNLVHQTPAQLAARFREAYRSATKEKAASMAYWLIERLNVGDFTDAQVRNAFGLTTTQYAALKTRMTALHDAHAAVQNAGSE